MALGSHCTTGLGRVSLWNMKSVLSIGYGRHLFEEENPERVRLAACADRVERLDAIVFSLRVHRLSEQRVSERFVLHPTNSRTRIGMLLDAYRIGRRLLREGNGNWVVSAQDPFEAGLVGYFVSRSSSAPLQVQEHGDFFGGLHWRRERLLNRFRYLFGRWLIHRADCVRVVSLRTKRHLEALCVVPERIRLLPVASDLASFRTPIEGKGLRDQFPDAEVIILFAGRLTKEKNLPLLIRAFSTTLVQYPTARLVIVGSGPEESTLRKMAPSEVAFLPWTRDLPAYMQSADIFALSSDREGWARVLVEAMAAGLPIVTTEVGCVGEVFISGQHGLAVPVRDEATYSAALATLIGDSECRARYGAQAAKDSGLYEAKLAPYAERWAATVETCGV